jgi:hypothetical protein
VVFNQVKVRVENNQVKLKIKLVLIINVMIMIAQSVQPAHLIRLALLNRMMTKMKKIWYALLQSLVHFKHVLQKRIVLNVQS